MLNQSLKTKRGKIARRIAFEVFKLPRVCEVCGSTERIEVHHKNKNRDDNSRQNLATLCNRHHDDLHGIFPEPKEQSPELKILSMLPKIDRRCKFFNKSVIKNVEERKIQTETYRKKWGISEGEGKDPNRVSVTCKICGTLGQRLENKGVTPRAFLCSAKCRKENKRRQKMMKIEDI